MVHDSSKVKKTLTLVTAGILSATVSLAAVSPPEGGKSVADVCADIQASAKSFKWKISDPCRTGKAQVGGYSVKGRPLIYFEYGVPNPTNTTLVFSMVHGDEITPLYVAVKLLDWLEKSAPQFKRSRVIVAPLVNPDGFLDLPRRRVNATGVDVNRNFPTTDWEAAAQAYWKEKGGADPRRFPGSRANSEPETAFQIMLLEKYKPQKILSVHAPLNFMDYDGPTTLSLARFPSEYVETCLTLRKRVRATSQGFFPGSLGNYAGQERGIPTLTLELPTADPKQADAYWHRFVKGMKTVIQFQVTNNS
jgi:protein MpaA